MNQLDYVVAITEDADTLFTLERQARHPKERQRLQLLRLLKSGLAMTMPEAAALVGISHSTADRQWRTYKRGGLEAMCSLAYKGGQARLSAEALRRLDERCAEGFSTLQSAAGWVKEIFAVSYTPSGYVDTVSTLGLQSQDRSPVPPQTGH